MQTEAMATATQPLELGCLQERNVITTDGRIIGSLSGAMVDTTTWKVSSIIVDVHKDVIEELQVKKQMLKTPKVNIDTSMVGNVSDVVQLNVPLANLKGKI